VPGFGGARGAGRRLAGCAPAAEGREPALRRDARRVLAPGGPAPDVPPRWRRPRRGPPAPRGGAREARRSPAPAARRPQSAAPLRVEARARRRSQAAPWRLVGRPAAGGPTAPRPARRAGRRRPASSVEERWPPSRGVRRLRRSIGRPCNGQLGVSGAANRPLGVDVLTRRPSLSSVAPGALLWALPTSARCSVSRTPVDLERRSDGRRSAAVDWPRRARQVADQ
jgi:hypothetical protein